MPRTTVGDRARLAYGIGQEVRHATYLMARSLDPGGEDHVQSPGPTRCVLNQLRGSEQETEPVWAAVSSSAKWRCG